MALLNPEPTLDDLCAAIARLEYMLERADPSLLDELVARIVNGRRSRLEEPETECLIGLIDATSSRKLRRRVR